MDIKTKHEIGDKLVNIHCTDEVFFVVQDIETVTCPAGTQIFYLCRIYAAKEAYLGSGKGKEVVRLGAGLYPISKLREDEVRPYAEKKPE